MLLQVFVKNCGWLKSSELESWPEIYGHTMDIYNQSIGFRTLHTKNRNDPNQIQKKINLLIPEVW